MQLSAFLSAVLSGGSIIDLDGTLFVQLAMFFVAFGLLYVLVFKPMVAASSFVTVLHLHVRCKHAS